MSSIGHNHTRYLVLIAQVNSPPRGILMVCVDTIPATCTTICDNT